jgi:hypothetical protein
LTNELKTRIQVVLAIGLVFAGARTAYIFYERHQDALRETRKEAAAALNPDFYVTPKKLYPYDLKTAQELTKQPVWIKVGYGISYFPYNIGAHHTDFSQEAGKFLPIEKIQVKKVVLDVAPDADERQVMAVFSKDGKNYAFPIGRMSNDTYHFIVNDLVFIEDPHELYKHWPPDVWKAIDAHQVLPGMNELQATMAVGIGLSPGPGASGNYGSRTLNYPNGGQSLSVRYEDGKAVEIKQGS